MGSPEVPLLPEPLSPNASLVTPNVSKILFDGPRSTRFEITSFEGIEPIPMFLGEILFGIQPDEPGSLQRTLSTLGQHRILFPPDFVQRLAHVLHNMEPVKNDFLLPFWKHVQHRMNVSLGHIHANGLDSINLFRGELLEIACQTLLTVPLGDFLHRTTIQIANDRDVVLPPAGRFFVDSIAGDDALLLSAEPAAHGPVEDIPGFIPADPQDLAGGFDICLSQHFNSKALKKQGETGSGLCPRQSYSPNAVFRAFDSGWPCMKQGLELAAVQMPPDPLFPMIVQRPFRTTFRTRPLAPLGMFHPNVNPLVFNIQFNLTGSPWAFEPKQILVESDVSHILPPLWRQRISQPVTH